MPTVPILFNVYDPVCTVNQCLSQVIGSIDSNPVAQYAACTSLFGAPTVSTVMPSVEVIFSTTTTTVPYTDIIVSVSTTPETSIETSTSYFNVVKTVSEYSATRVATQTAVVTAQHVKKRGAHKRRGCRKPSATSSLPVSSAGVSSSVASSASASASASASVSASASAPASSSTSQAPSSTAYPIASNCPTLEEHSSACACIFAVESTSTVTEIASATISVVTVEESSAVPSVSVTVSTLVVPTTIVEPAITTITTTTTGIWEATTTATSIVAPPTATSYVVLGNGPRTGRYLTVVSDYIQYDLNNQGVSVGAKFNLPTPSGQPTLNSNPSMKWILRSASSHVGVLGLGTDETVTTRGDIPVTCNVDENGVVTCTAPSKGFTRMWNCGAYMYLSSPNWAQGGCTEITFKMSN
ncbi:hypothetical protein OQA88_8182 [Cercophora sp. LCS_1]